eukprot:CAMPEP_0172625488 /NCGR_PEP_ID=MMETSP1068-20121228/144132_1 /TAXON_ID=35684 /ORGANISM="Pseudopedinella elastica, Strain CCMP716" /LENGTH=75 /DNA_ID=CAMNT_0013434801 /DNA_START=51 /DNA_END=278 /DNA_ORIENTATION=+
MSHNLASKGLPLVLFVVGGSYSLSYFVQGHVEAKDVRVKTSSQREFNLEEEHRKAIGKLNIDEYDMVPVPKPSSS